MTTAIGVTVLLVAVFGGWVFDRARLQRKLARSEQRVADAMRLASFCDEQFTDMRIIIGQLNPPCGICGQHSDCDPVPTKDRKGYFLVCRECEHSEEDAWFAEPKHAIFRTVVDDPCSD